MPKTYAERAAERITLDYPVPVTRPPNARTGERPADQVAAARLHEFHPAPPPHVQSSHGNRGGRKAAAVPDTPKAVKAATRARAPKAATAVKGKPKLKDLVAKQKPSDKETVAAANEIWGGTFGGLTAEVTEATPVHMSKSEKSLIIAGDIKDAKGNRIGTFTRSVSDKDGKLTASHSSLNLSPKVRGQGFAEAFNNNAIDWYRNNGVQEVHLYTTDVGGYAWARAGYDFASEESAQAIRMRVLEAADPGSTRNTDVGGKAARIPKERLDEQRRLAGELFDRSEDAKFGEVGYPTPYEISQLGRWPGAGKDDMWIGKAIMLDSSWKGVRYL